MSSVPLITQVRDRFAVILASQVTAGVIRSYVEFPAEEIDNEEHDLPFCGYVITPQGWLSRNRLELNDLLLHMQVQFTNEDGRNAVLDSGWLIETYLHKAIFADCKSGVLHSLTQKIVKSPAQVLIADEVTGLVIMEYSLTMLHNYGDGFLRTNY